MYSPGKQLQAPDDEEDQLQDLDFLISGTLSTTKFNYETVLMQEASFGLSSPKSRSAKKRKSNITETHGGRIVRAAGRKDRHSKVCTASGPRDRRVRLSPRTAIQFYDVQDRLGYDRPSKAIDWLIKEAKAAIDALDEKNQQMQQGFGEYLFSQNPCSGFGFLSDVAQPPCTTDQLQGFADHYLINPSSNRNGAPDQDPIYSQGFCSDWDISRLQKVLTVDSVNSSLQPPDPASGDGEIFSQREPLQSSIINYSPIISSHFPAGFSFSSELSKITGVGTIKADGKEKKTVSSRPSSTAPNFLHYED